MGASGGAENIGFEKFTRYMVSITEDKTSSEQLIQSFQVIANKKVTFILRLLFIYRTISLRWTCALVKFPRIKSNISHLRCRKRSVPKMVTITSSSSPPTSSPNLINKFGIFSVTFHLDKLKSKTRNKCELSRSIRLLTAILSRSHRRSVVQKEVVS